MTVIVPSTETELKAHYQTRYETLRLPWGQPPGSERDGPEDDNILASAYDKNKRCIGVARLLPLSNNEGQIRSMGVAEHTRGQGVGRELMSFLETKAAELGITHVVLHARENAVQFYEAAGYRVMQESYVLWGTIQHYKMEKWLEMSTETR